MAAAALALALAALAAACGGAGADGRPVVLGASSLALALPAVDPSAEHRFAPSDLLAVQVREGAPADVVAAADERLTARLFAEGLVERPRAFATNRLVLLVPRGDPAGVRTPADLGREGVRLVMGAEGVPVGDYARALLARLGRADLVGRAAGFEADATAVARRVALGEADAGIAYATDAAAVAGDVDVVELPARAQPPIRYAVAVVRSGREPEAARAYVARLLGREGRAALRAAGFGLP